MCVLASVVQIVCLCGQILSFFYVVGPSGWDVGTELMIKLTYVKCTGISTVAQK